MPWSWWRADRDDIGDRKVLVLALDSEVDRQRASVSHRATSITNRASILIGSAGIFTAFQAPESGSIWFMASIVVSGAAAIIGVLALLPRLGGELDIRQMEWDYWNNRDTEAIRNLTAAKLSILRVDEEALKRKRSLLLVGFAALGLSICFGAVHVLISVNYF